MEEFCIEIEALGHQQRLVPAEQIIMDKLSVFEIILRENDPPQNLNQLIAQLLLVNKGKLSAVCAFRIVDCLILLGEASKPCKSSFVFQKVRHNWCQSLLYASSRLLTRMDSVDLVELDKLVDLLLTKVKNEQEAQLYALYTLTKHFSHELAKNASTCFKIAHRGLYSKQPVVVLFSIQLMQSLAVYTDVSIKQILPILADVFTKASTPLQTFEASLLAAKVLYQSWLNKIDVVPYLEPIGRFTVHILEHFISIISEKHVEQIMPLMLEAIRDVSPSDISKIIKRIPEDKRASLFAIILSEKSASSAQLNILQALAETRDEISEAAALAFQLSTSDIPSSRQAASSFFLDLPKLSSEVASQYLDSTLLIISQPPDNNPRQDKDIRAMTNVASNILAGSDQVFVPSDAAKAYYSVFLTRALAIRDMFDAQLLAAFVLMTSWPFPPPDKEAVAAAILAFMSFAESPEGFAAVQNLVIKQLAIAIAVFCVVYPGYEGSQRLFWLLVSARALQSIVGYLAVYYGAPQLLENTSRLTALAHTLQEAFLDLKPNMRFIRSRIANPIPIASDILSPSVYPGPRYSNLFWKLPKSDYTFYIMEQYPEMIQAISSDAVPGVLFHLFRNDEKTLISHLLLLSLVMNPITVSLPQNYIQNLLSTMKPDCDLIRLQLTAEVIAISPGKDDLKTYANTLDGFTKVVLYKSFVVHTKLSDEMVRQIMHETSEFLLNSNKPTVCLHTLKMLFKKYKDIIASSHESVVLCRILQTFMLTTEILRPEDLLLLDECLCFLLPLSISELSNERTETLKLLLSIMQGFTEITKFASQAVTERLNFKLPKVCSQLLEENLYFDEGLNEI